MGVLIIVMHQSFDEYDKIFALGDMVELDNGMPEFESIVGVGIVIKVEDDDVIVFWQSDVWASGRRQKMKTCEIRHAHLL